MTAVFVGGPLDGGAEPLLWCPAMLVFPSLCAHHFVITDVVYVLLSVDEAGTATYRHQA